MSVQATIFGAGLLLGAFILFAFLFLWKD